MLHDLRNSSAQVTPRFSPCRASKSRMRLENLKDPPRRRQNPIYFTSKRCTRYLSPHLSSWTDMFQCELGSIFKKLHTNPMRHKSVLPSSLGKHKRRMKLNFEKPPVPVNSMQCQTKQTARDEAQSVPRDSSFSIRFPNKNTRGKQEVTGFASWGQRCCGDSGDSGRVAP